METLDRKAELLSETETSTCGCALNRSVALSNCRTEEPLAVILWHKRDGETDDQLSFKKSHRTEGDQILTERSEFPLTTVNVASENSEYHPCSSSLVPALQMSWEADRSWSLRMLTLLLQCARLRMLMAWCSTLGGAHSSLGEAFVMHAEKAGEISHQQLALATEMGDLRLASQCKLYVAFSLLQRGRLNRAAKIIREQYRFAKSEAAGLDPKVISMCLSAWIRLKHLHQARKASRLQIQEVG